MTPANDPDVRRLMDASLHRSIRQLAIRLLDHETPSLDRYRLVERLMRIAIALGGAGGTRAPRVKIHKMPADESPGVLPEIISVDLADLLADRGADSVPGALLGDPESLERLVQVGAHLIETEEIQLG